MLPILLCALVAAPPDVQVTRWVSPDNSRPTSFEEWRAGQTPEPWQVRTLQAARGNDDPRVDILVEADLADTLASRLVTMAADLVNSGYSPAVYSVAGTSAESLRAFLVAERDSGLRSAVFVGDLPVAWFQVIDDFNSNGRRDPDEGYEEFPCDLYFMDLDGEWRDEMVQLDTLDSMVPGSDGIYDAHEGDIVPEIGISRMPASAIGDEVVYLCRLLDKAHAYRNGRLPVADRALVYIDDDWVPNAVQWDYDVGYLYPDRVFIWDRETTRIAEYRPRIDTAAYQWIQLCSHSWPGGHAMKYNSGQNWDWFYADQIYSLNPQANFYNLFACSNARYVERGYCGGVYVFGTTTGLGAIGSTKTGSMLSFGDFYYSLSEGKSLAEALRVWFEMRLFDGRAPWELAWFYGMCLIGDGLLTARVPTALAETRDMTETFDVSDRVPSRLSLSPRSPARGRMDLSFTLGRSGPAQVGLYDHSGRMVLSHGYGSLPVGNHRHSLDVPQLPAGVYQLVLTAGSYRTSRSVALVR